MQVRFHGNFSTEETITNLIRVLHLFEDHYAIKNFCSVHLNLNLINDKGEFVELVDLSTSEILGVFDVYQSKPHKEQHLRLVVDNTKPSI